MRTNYFLTGLAALTLLFASCEADDTADIIINNTDNSTITNNNGGSDPDPNNPTGEDIELKGTFTEDLTLDSINNYTLTGPVVMAPGTRLRIPAGMTINAQAGGAGVYIAISQGASIDAQGTASDPIVLTSNASNKAPGDWGGLIILGKAPINSAANGKTSTSEIGGLPYGGGDASDFSGVISYVRVEYSGGKASASEENNGFSFYGVGNGTTVNHIQSYIGADDGVEFFGGTVNVNNISVIGMEDDSVDWTEGFTGTLTDVYIEQIGEKFDKGLEGDGYNKDIGNLAEPMYFSSPTITNVTIIGVGSDFVVDPKTGSGNTTANIRVGTSVKIANAMITGYATAFDLDGDTGSNPTGQGVVDGDTGVSKITFTDVTLNLKNDTGVEFGEDDFFSGIGNGTGTDYGDWGAGWTVGK